MCICTLHPLQTQGRTLCLSFPLGPILRRERASTDFSPPRSGVLHTAPVCITFGDHPRFTHKLSQPAHTWTRNRRPTHLLQPPSQSLAGHPINDYLHFWTVVRCAASTTIATQIRLLSDVCMYVHGVLLYHCSTAARTLYACTLSTPTHSSKSKFSRTCQSAKSRNSCTSVSTYHHFRSGK